MPVCLQRIPAFSPALMTISHPEMSDSPGTNFQISSDWWGT